MKKILVVGSLNMDFVVNVEQMPLVGETILADTFNLIPGGKGANQACALGKLGANVTMLGAVGNDEYGKIELESLSAAGVDVSHIAVLDNVKTGVALIPVNSDGDNSIIVIQGANKHVTPEYINSKIEQIKECDIIIFQLEIPMETVVHTAKLAKELGKTVILDPAPAPKRLPSELLKNIDIIKPNETEIATITGTSSEIENLDKSIQILKNQGIDTVLVTLGGDGVYLSLKDNSTHRIHSQKVKVVDTTAAGDTFTAALALGLANGDDIVASAEFANKVSAIVVTKKGAQSSIPTMDEVVEYYKN